MQACSNNVVQQFARVAQITGFVYCFSILEANKRSEYSSSRNLSTPLRRTASETDDRSLRTPITSNMPAMVFDADFTMFFPFDPYRLPKSSSYIQGVYREWNSVAIDDEEDEDEDDDDDDDDDDEEEEEEDFQRGGQSDGENVSDDCAGGLPDSFNGMSISPVRPLQLRAALAV